MLDMSFACDVSSGINKSMSLTAMRPEKLQMKQSCRPLPASTRPGVGTLRGLPHRSQWRIQAFGGLFGGGKGKGEGSGKVMSMDLVLFVSCYEVHPACQVPGLNISWSAPILMSHLIAAGEGMQKVQKHRNSNMPWLQGN